MAAAEAETRILERAYVPEHIPGLMVALSGGEPRLLDDVLVLWNDPVAVAVGYALAGPEVLVDPDALHDELRVRWGAEAIRYVGPSMPAVPRPETRELGRDTYYAVDVVGPPVAGRLDRLAARASRHFEVRWEDAYAADHEAMSEAFVERVRPAEDARELYARMPAVAAARPSCRVLAAYGPGRRLAAFYVMEREAPRFDAYLLGARAEAPWAAHASDLLMFEALRACREAGKERLELGLGVSPGIARFKRKWGGVPCRPYVSCEWNTPRPRLRTMLRSLWRGVS